MEQGLLHIKIPARSHHKYNLGMSKNTFKMHNLLCSPKLFAMTHSSANNAITTLLLPHWFLFFIRRMYLLHVIILEKVQANSPSKYIWQLTDSSRNDRTLVRRHIDLDIEDKGKDELLYFSHAQLMNISQEEKNRRQVDWRREKVLALASDGYGVVKIARQLEISHPTVSRDMQYLRKQAKEQIHRWESTIWVSQNISGPRGHHKKYVWHYFQ